MSALVNARAPLTVLLDALGEVAPADGLGVAHEVGVGALNVGFEVMAVAVDGFLESCGGLLDFARRNAKPKRGVWIVGFGFGIVALSFGVCA